MLTQRPLVMAISAILLTAVSTAHSANSIADKVVILKPYDGSSTITGELSFYADGRYVIATDLGTLTISAIPVECLGAACPSEEEVQADLDYAG